MVCVVEGVEELDEKDGAADEYEQHDEEEDGKVARWQVAITPQEEIFPGGIR